MKKVVIEITKIIFAVGLISWLLKSGKLQFDGLDDLFRSDFLIAAGLLMLGNIFFAAERWRILIQIQGLTPKAWQTLKLSLIGMFFNFAMPGGVGGDVVKAWYFHKDFKDSKVIAVSSVLIDRVLGLYAMLLLALSTMLFDLSYIFANSILKSLFVIVLLAWLSSTVALFFLFSKKIYRSGFLELIFNKVPLGHKFNKLYNSLHAYGEKPKHLVSGVGLSLLSQFCSIAFLWLVVNTLHSSPIDFHTIAFVAPLGFITTAIPIAPAGIGVGQAAFYYLFNLYTGHESSIGSVSITAFQIGQFLLALFGAFFYLARRKKSGSLDSIQDIN